MGNVLGDQRLAETLVGEHEDDVSFGFEEFESKRGLDQGSVDLGPGQFESKSAMGLERSSLQRFVRRSRPRRARSRSSRSTTIRASGESPTLFGNEGDDVIEIVRKAGQSQG